MRWPSADAGAPRQQQPDRAIELPADRAGVYGLSNLAMTPDARAYTYTAGRTLSGDLFVVEGLK